MEPILSTCSCLTNLTSAQREQAEAVAGGDFSKILMELQIIRSSFSSDKPKSSGLSEYKRPEDIMNVFYSKELQSRQPGADPYFLEKKFSYLGPSAIKTMI